MSASNSPIAKILKDGLESSGYKVNEILMQGQDFHLLIAYPPSKHPSIEIYKENDSQYIIYAANIKLRQNQLQDLEYNFELQSALRRDLEDLHKSLKVDFYEIEDDVKDYHISLKCVSSVEGFAETAVRCINDLNEAGNAVLNVVSKHFPLK